MDKEIELYISTQTFSQEDVRGKTAVVIDVLRASSTIVTSLQNGAKGVIPVADMDAAGNLSKNMDSPQYLLCGEKNGEKIEGYQLGNSPLKYVPETVKGKTIILNTTNGTKAVKKAELSNQLVIASFLNAKTVGQFLNQDSNDITIICAGWRGQLSFEDLLCGGKIIYDLYNGTLPDNASGATKIAFDCFKKYGDDIKGAIDNSAHARRLKGKINPKDIDHCCDLNKMDILPILNDGIIADANGKEKEINK